MENPKAKIQNPKATPETKVAGKREARAVGKYLHISPTKVRDLMRLIRGKSVAEAETTLRFSGRRGGEVALKVLKSAEAAAGTGFSKETWVVKDARADKGPIFRRRVLPRARGSADIIKTPGTHITIVLGERSSRGS